jgi:hypothetical protein
MTAKLVIPVLAAVAAAVGSVASVTASAAPASPSHAALVIRHQLHGCHSWSLNGDAYGAHQAVSLRRGGAISIRNNDVMSHKLVETSGPAVTITRVASAMGMGLTGTFPPSMMARMGSVAKVTFTKPGVYTFTTKAGEDYMSGVKTIGEDNVLELTVTVR